MTQTSAVGPGIELAGQGRRLAAYILDIVLFTVTLAIGWLIWLLVVGGRGQSPGKQLLGIHVVHEDGNWAGLGWMLLREIVLKWALFSAVSLGLSAAIGSNGALIVLGLFALAALWCVWDKNRQCLWDKVLRTGVVHGGGQGGALAATGPSSGGSGNEVAENLRTLAELHERGLLTDEEYEERRAREMERL